MRNTKLIIMVVLLSTFPVAHFRNAEAQVRLVSSDPHLKSIEKDIEAIRQAVAQIDIGSFNVSYDEGKHLERRVKVVQSRLDTAKTWIASLRRRETLLGEFSLAVTLEALHASMEGLESAVMRRSVQAAEALFNSRELMVEVLIKYEDFLSSNMRPADSILGLGPR